MLTEGLGNCKSLVWVFQCCSLFAERVDGSQDHWAEADGASGLVAELGAWGWALLATEAFGHSALFPAVFSGEENHVFF